MFELRHFTTANGKDIFGQWLKDMRDTRAQAAILARLERLESGTLGDVKPVRSGVHELRIDVGAGYRLYFAQRGRMILLLLCGGDKSTQDRNITQALKYLKEFDQRNS